MIKRLTFLLFILAVLPVVSGEIFIGQLNDIYNSGDEVSAQITLIPNSNTADHFKVDMVCGNIRTNIFNQYFNLQQGQQQVINANTQMIKDYFTFVTVLNSTNSTTYQNLSIPINNSNNANNSSTGNGTINNFLITKYKDCYLSVLYGSDSSSSNNFGVSQKIFIDVDLNLDKYNPGEKVKILGNAEKESGLLVNGYLEIFVDSLGIYKSETISEGLIDFSFEIPKNGKSGEHNITIKIFESNHLGEHVNEGVFFDKFKVNQILTDLKILLESESVAPGKDFIYLVNTYDQAGDIISEDISVVFYKPGDSVFFKKLIKPESEQKFGFDLNETPGYWKIEANVAELSKRKLFYLEEIKKIQTSLINDTLIVTNIGNVLYEGPLEITIGSTVEVKRLKLKISETQRFRLRAPNGAYSISVNDGTETFVLGNSVGLTGNAIRVVDVREGFLEVFRNSWVWWLIVILFVLIVAFVYIKRTIMNKKKNSVSSGKEGIINKKSSTNILHGSKEHAYVVAIKSESSKDSDYVTNTVNKTLLIAKNSGAKVYIDGDYKIIVFSPRLTKKKNNELGAIIIAKKIEEILLEHNKRYKEKISFGIGINDGEIISEISNGQFKFTTTGGLIGGAKRVAQNYKMKVLLSDTMHRRVAGSVRTKKSSEGNYWEVVKIPDRSGQKDLLDRVKK